MRKSLGKIVQPQVFGSKGGATTLLLVVLITVLWLSITGRIKGVKAALASSGASGESTGSDNMSPPVTVTGGIGGLHKNPDGSYSLPSLPPLVGGIGH